MLAVHAACGFEGLLLCPEIGTVHSDEVDPSSRIDSDRPAEAPPDTSQLLPQLRSNVSPRRTLYRVHRGQGEIWDQFDGLLKVIDRIVHPARQPTGRGPGCSN